MQPQAQPTPINNAAVLKRRLRLKSGGTTPPASPLEADLKALPGVVEARVQASGRKVKLRYDVTQTRLDNILAVIEESGAKLSNNLVQRTKLTWYRYTDDTTRENVQAGGGACCSNPADVYARRQKH